MTTAYRNGNGGVVLGLESNCSENTIEHDACFQSDTNYNKWINKRLCWVKTFASKVGSTSQDKINCLVLLMCSNDNVVTAMTISSNTVEWFSAEDSVSPRILYIESEIKCCVFLKMLERFCASKKEMLRHVKTFG